MSAIGTSSLAEVIKFFRGHTERCTFGVTTLNKILPDIAKDTLSKLDAANVQQLLILNTKFTLLSTINQSLECKGDKIISGLKAVVVERSGSAEKLYRQITQYLELSDGFIRNYEEVVGLVKNMGGAKPAEIEVLEKIKSQLNGKARDNVLSIQKNVATLTESGEVAPEAATDLSKHPALRHAMDLLKKGGVDQERAKTFAVVIGGKQKVVGDVVGYRIRERVLGIEHALIGRNKDKDRGGKDNKIDEGAVAKVLGVPKNEIEEYLKMRLHMSKNEHIAHLEDVLEINIAGPIVKHYEDIAQQIFTIYEDVSSKDPAYQNMPKPETLSVLLRRLSYIIADLCAKQPPRDYSDKLHMQEPKISKFVERVLYCQELSRPEPPENIVISQTSYTGKLESDLRALVQIEIDLSKYMQALEIHYGIMAQEFQELIDLLGDFVADIGSDVEEKKKLGATLRFLEEAEDPKVVQGLREKLQKVSNVPLDFEKPVLYNIYRMF